MFNKNPKSPRRGNSSRNRYSLPEIKFITELKENLRENGLLATKSVKKAGWIFGLIIIYIFFQHNINTLVTRKDKADTKMKEVRAAYITNKASYMFESKHSEISKKMKSLGMDSNIEPPIKIVVKD